MEAICLDCGARRPQLKRNPLGGDAHDREHPANMTFPHRMKLSSAVTLCAAIGCFAGWRRVALPPDTALAPRQQVQLWQGRTSRVLHAVRLKADSLYGIPFQRPPTCDTCTVALPLAEIDSLRLGNQETPGVAIVSLSFGALLVGLYILLHGLSGS